MKINEGFTEFKEKDFSVRISAPERAMLEMLSKVRITEAPPKS